jgi:hypothetical protein
MVEEVDVTAAAVVATAAEEEEDVDLVSSLK